MLRQSARVRLLKSQLQTAHDFLELARLGGMALQESRAAVELIAEAEHNADVAEEIVKDMPAQFEQDRQHFTYEIAKLRKAIEETHQQLIHLL